MRIEVIHAGFFKLDGGAMFGVVPKSIWENINPPDSKNLCTWAMRLLYIETGHHKVLIDTGMGEKQSPKFFSYYEPQGPKLEESLALKGIQKEDITDVLLTHLHFDHCGGAVEEKEGILKPFFPNAKYWTNRAHLNWAQFPNEREKASFLKENIEPLIQHGALNFIEKEGEWISGIDIKFFHGHTESMMIPFIKYGDRTLVYCADLLPSAGHIPLPYIMAYDTRPLLTMEEKKLFLNQVAKEDQILFFEHDPIHECAELEKTEKGIRIKRTFNFVAQD